jgi:predicted Zn-dependent protease
LKAELIEVEAEINGVDRAVAEARALAVGDPESDTYDLLLASLYEKAGRSTDAIAVLEEVAAAKPSENVTIALARLIQPLRGSS